MVNNTMTKSRNALQKFRTNESLIDILSTPPASPVSVEGTYLLKWLTGNTFFRPQERAPFLNAYYWIDRNWRFSIFFATMVFQQIFLFKSKNTLPHVPFLTSVHSQFPCCTLIAGLPIGDRRRFYYENVFKHVGTTSVRKGGFRLPVIGIS